jgi:hypothetical protein
MREHHEALQQKKSKGLAGAARNMWGRSAATPAEQPVSKLPSLNAQGATQFI